MYCADRVISAWHFAHLIYKWLSLIWPLGESNLYECACCIKNGVRMHHIGVLVCSATSENVPTAVNCAVQTTSQNRHARVCGNFPVARHTAPWVADDLHALWCTSSQIVTGVTLVVFPVQLLKHIVYPCLIVYSHGYALDNTSSGDKWFYCRFCSDLGCSCS